MTRESVEASIACALKPLGYTKRGTTWCLDRTEVISVVNLQKSQWGPELYVNLSVYLKALGEERRPSEARCHLRRRASPKMGRPLPADGSAWGPWVAEIAVPWLDALSDATGVAAFMRTAAAAECLIDQRVAGAVGLAPSTPAI